MGRRPLPTRLSTWPDDFWMEIRTHNCTLRPFRESDAASIARHADSREVWLHLRDAFPHPYALSDAEQYIAAVADHDPVTHFAIEVDQAAVGGISLRVGSDVERRSAELGYWLGEEYWGRGIMSSAVRAITGYALGELGLLRVFAVPFDNNPASVRVLEKAGYRREGLMRKSAVKDGVVLDQFLYAAIREGVGS